MINRKQLFLAGCVIYLAGCTEEKNVINVLDAVSVKTTVYAGSCEIHYTYPEISSVLDSSFEKQINELLRANVTMLASDFIDAAQNDDYKQYCNTSYRILNVPSENDDVLSVFQEAAFFEIKAGERKSSVTNFDMKNSKVLGNKGADWGFSFDDKNLINTAITAYLDQVRVSSVQEPVYPLIQNEDDFNKLVFGVENGQIVLALYVAGCLNVPHDYYFVPIAAYNPYNSDENSPAEMENFDTFVTQFTTDSLFQLSRIWFPVGNWKYSMAENCTPNSPYFDSFYGDCIQEVLMNRKNWSLLIKDNLTPYYDDDSYAKWAKHNSELAVFVSGWIKGDLLYKMTFRPMREKWFLVEYTTYFLGE
ncbi:MAG: hypothetical protein LBD45_03620 [Bacteroidales bacterium]|nr:hypothetical protein [Bacteroidales bacterium]